MFLARVKGHIVATTKDPAIQGQKLLVVEPLKVDYADGRAAAAGGASSSGGGGTFDVTGRAIIAMDHLGAGEGQLVLIVQGSSARMANGMNKTPTDAVVIGIVDEAIVDGKPIK